MNNVQQGAFPTANAYSIFLLNCRAQRYRKSTLDFYKWKLFPFIKWTAAQGAADLGAINANHIRGYLVECQEKGQAGHTVHGIARAIRAFFNFCVNDEMLTNSPMRKVKMPRRPKKILEAFTRDCIHKMKQAASSEREQALILFLLDTGLRASECISLNGGDVDLKSGTVQVRSGKGDKDRTVYMGTKTVGSLCLYYAERGMPSPNAPVWVAEREPHSRLTYSGLRQLFKRLGEVTGVEHCHPHTFRRTFALNCLRNGMNIYALQWLMGHEDLKTLRQYLALVEADIMAAHRQFGVVDNL